ncbi:MAG: hypothetical protein C4519_15660 [Desulfobacteraceae bacterium]|nr:MAG: hypothetical protein C4519_15660 [Desulfobacteraceae bacterium]
MGAVLCVFSEAARATYAKCSSFAWPRGSQKWAAKRSWRFQVSVPKQELGNEYKQTPRPLSFCPLAGDECERGRGEMLKLLRNESRFASKMVS